MAKYHKCFEVATTRLSASEQQVLAKLVEASELVGPLFALQENDEFPGANFYPHDATSEEIEDAAQKNPRILDPYTVVERGRGGKLVAVPFHKKYREYMLPIAQLLKEAAALSENPSFSEFLAARAKSFLNGSWDKSETLWLGIEDSRLDILIGPIEPYLDNLFSVKCAFQSNVRVASGDAKFNPQDYLNIVRCLHASSPVLSGEDEPGHRVQVRVDDVVCLSGRNAKLPPRGANYPNDPQRVAELGTKIIIYTTDIKLRDEGLITPVFEKLFDDDFRAAYSKEGLLSAAVRLTMLHEITEAVVKYPDTVSRLKDMYLPVKELHASVVGIKSCTFHVLKGVLTQKDYEEILLVLLCRTFSDWLIKDGAGQTLMHYLRGYVVAFNFFREQGALVVENGMIQPDFDKLFVGVDGLSSVLTHLMSSGSQEDARRFFDQYGSFAIFEEFGSQLQGIDITL